MRMGKTVAAALFATLTLVSVSQAVEMASLPQSGLLIRVDWQTPDQLPPKFRNHCTAENFTGRPYCSNHCGIDYQFFYCSQVSFGCCHLGHGYCDWDGHLRCSP
jgi:hypothetical protein